MASSSDADAESSSSLGSFGRVSIDASRGRPSGGGDGDGHGEVDGVLAVDGAVRLRRLRGVALDRAALSSSVERRRVMV